MQIGARGGVLYLDGGWEQLLDALAKPLEVRTRVEVLEHVAPDVVCISDSGPLKRSGHRPVVGGRRVARLLVNLARRHADGMEVRAATVNGDFGVIISLGDEVDLVTAFEVDEGRVTTIRMMRNQDKLTHVDIRPPLR